MSSINLQASQTTGCETYIAIVVDESGSINAEESQQIRDALTLFINSQAQSNITLSLIGMSNSDNAVRPDDVLEKRISGNKEAFLDWINLYGNGRAYIQSDYWASGLNTVKNLSVVPDIVFIISDGMQVNNTRILKDLYQHLNLNSHIFSYSVTGNLLEETLQKEVTGPLNFYLDRSPVEKVGSKSILESDFVWYSDFSHLLFELSNLHADLSKAQIGCTANVEILENKLALPSLNKNKTVSKSSGTLLLKNKGKVSLHLAAGTKIHDAANINGLIFTILSTVIIPGSSEIEVAIRISGKPLRNGKFSAPVALVKVKNNLGIKINFTVGSEPQIIDISSGKTNLQSTHLQIAAAGSRGIDSTKGIHLRWLLAGKLGKEHLPKGNLFIGEKSNSSFNKPNDFVKVYRAPYTKVSYNIDLTNGPNVVDNKKAIWIYKSINSTRSIYVNFQDTAKYKAIKLGIDPLVNPTAFLQAYGNSLIEIENKTELFFATELNFSSSNTAANVRIETLSVSENSITAAKRITNRKTFAGSQLQNIRLVAENGRSIRFKAKDCLLSTISFEFYSDFITNANINENWILKGNFSLNDNDNKVFEQLEPKLNAVHGKWLNFNDEDYVNINNYKDKWNKPTDKKDITAKNIKQIVADYIELSEVANNPTAAKDIPFGDKVPVNEPEDGQEQLYAENLTNISYLDLLNISANDYHIARMLGLGCIDMDGEIFSGDFVYLTEYITFGSLSEGIEGKEVQHLSMSIPTSINTERLPLPVQLNKIVPGLNMDSEENQNANITDPNGYSFDGKKRYLSLFMDDVMDYAISDKTFFKSTLEYDGSSFTFPTYVEVEQKIDTDPAGKKTVLSVNEEYYNVNKKLENSNFEPVPIVIPESGKSILNVRQEKVGENTYTYQGFGINIFSRASAGRQISIKSDIKPANNLMAPSNINCLLVTKEKPLLFTSLSEQIRFNEITSKDKTLVRILFDYYSAQELLSYTVPTEMSVEDAEKSETIFPDDKEIFADHFRFYYKDGLPEVEYGKIESIDNKTKDNLTTIVKIREYKILSSGQEIKIALDNTNKSRFDGGILTIDDQNYVIKNIEVVLKKDIEQKDVFDYALVEVLRKEVTESLHADGDASLNSDQIKPVKIPENKLCTLVQNMQTACNWYNPQVGFKVSVPSNLAAVHREVIQPKSENTKDLQVEKTRGIWENAKIERFLEKSYEMNADGTYKVDNEIDQNPILLEEEKHLGLYKITFPGFNLPQHSQFKNGSENSVEWSNGIVRLFTNSAIKTGNPVPVKTRKEFKVFQTENIGATGDLILYINDTDFKLGDYIQQTMDPAHDEIITGLQKVNYYPSYKVYLYTNQTDGITQENIQPRKNESTQYSIFGVSTHSTPDINYKSKISVPSPMYAVRIEEPVKPEEIKSDSLYATRPDFYNRSTFTFKTKYTDERKPYGLLHYRANEEDFLSILYERTTIDTIREELKKLGGNEEIDFQKRWKNFLNFNELETDGNYKTFPSEESELKYRFPLPDNQEFIKLINDFIDWHNSTLPKNAVKAKKITSINALNKVIISVEEGIEKPLLAVHFIEQAIQSAFISLTEVPVVYEHINGIEYVPVNKKQTIKDKNGHALKPSDSDFDIAPMMKIASETENITQFTDFNLDGNSQNIYFYAVREMDIKMNFSEFSDILGPVKLVASGAPQTPEIKRIMPILENQVLGIKPAVQIELNAYQPEYNIKKINIYRANSFIDAQSIRTMKLAKEILIDEDTLSANFDNVWTVYDDFEDLECAPFAEGLFYRITVSRQIEYPESESSVKNPVIKIDYAPSQPSKITATVIVDNVSPESPVLEASATPTGTNGSILKSVVFNWEKTVYNGKYHFYKMTRQGNWEKIHEVASNLDKIVLPLNDIDNYTDELIIKTADGERIYHHFKMISENSSGMYSSEEKILTL